MYYHYPTLNLLQLALAGGGGEQLRITATDMGGYTSTLLLEPKASTVGDVKRAIEEVKGKAAGTQLLFRTTDDSSEDFGEKMATPLEDEDEDTEEGEDEDA